MSSPKYTDLLDSIISKDAATSDEMGQLAELRHELTVDEMKYVLGQESKNNPWILTEIGYMYSPNGSLFDRSKANACLSKSIDYYKRSANLGNMYGMQFVAGCYFFGKGCEKDMKEAFNWNIKGAAAGNCDCYMNLSYHYSNGEGTQKDVKKGLECTTKAADQGNVMGAFNLGLMYYRGDSVGQDYQKAKKYLLKAAKLDFPPACQILFEFYRDGKDGKVDNDRAFKWIGHAYELNPNDPTTLNSMALCYINGLGVEKNIERAQELISQADQIEAKFKRTNKN